MSSTTLDQPTEGPAPDRAEPEPPGTAVRVTLAALLAVSGAVHLVMVPDHYQADALEGIGFAVVGWAQLALAVTAVTSSSRAVLRSIVGLNLAVLGLWAWSRIAGLPVGAHAGEAESVTTIDGLTAAFEGAAVVLAGAALARPGLGARLKESGLVLASIVPVAILLAGTLALTSPDVTDHVHGSDDDLVSGTLASASERCDLSFNPASYWRETEVLQFDTMTGGAMTDAAGATGGHGGHDHGATAATGDEGHPDPFEGRGSAELDDLMAETEGAEGELGAAKVVTKLSDVDDEVYEAWLHQLHALNGGHDAHEASGDDDGGHGGHMGPQPWIGLTDAEQCATLEAELTTARELALSYPTAADATAAGWVRVTPYVPGIAAHYMNFGYVDGVFELEKPEMILYDGSGPDAKVVGLSYYVVHEAESEPTQGFTGGNDHYHRHVGLCVSAAGVIGDTTTTDEECAERGGRKQNGGAGWMSHAWVVPGCESPWGVFSAANPLLDVALGTASDAGETEGGCDRSGVRDRYDLEAGSIDNTPSTVSGATEEQAAG